MTQRQQMTHYTSINAHAHAAGDPGASVVLTLDQAGARPGPRAVAVGFFDGVHIGHQTIIRRLVNEAAAGRLLPTCLTFEPHPLQVIEGRRGGPPMLTTLDEKVSIMRDMGVGECVVAPFTPEFAAHSPGEFAQLVVRETLDARVVMVGYNFTFGRSGFGKADDLRRFGEDLGFRVIVVDPVMVNGVPVSSTAVRQAVSQGDMYAARGMLGRPYSVRGRVVHGDGRGRRLGIPTANVDVPAGRLLPLGGVYATIAYSGDLYAASVTNVGSRPTFAQGPEGPARAPLVLETYVPGFSGNLYGRNIEIRFLKRLRDERRFEKGEDLVRQVLDDARQALHLASREAPEGG